MIALAVGLGLTLLAAGGAMVYVLGLRSIVWDHEERIEAIEERSRGAAE